MDQDDVIPERVVAIGLLTQHDLNLLGARFDRLWPVEDAPEFDELLKAIDEADDRFRQVAEAPDKR